MHSTESGRFLAAWNKPDWKEKIKPLPVSSHGRPDAITPARQGESRQENYSPVWVAMEGCEIWLIRDRGSVTMEDYDQDTINDVIRSPGRATVGNGNGWPVQRRDARMQKNLCRTPNYQAIELIER